VFGIIGEANVKAEGESDVSVWEKSIEISHERELLSVHDLVNKLAVIVGHCDLLNDHLKAGSQMCKACGCNPRYSARNRKGIRGTSMPTVRIGLQGDHAAT